MLNLDDFNLFGVFDGHGMYGHFVSNAVKNFLLSFYTNIDLYFNELKKHNALKEDIILEKFKSQGYAIVKSSFIKAEEDLGNAKFDSNFSGTTSVLIIMLGPNLICANAGDSRVIVVSDNSNSGDVSFVNRE